jgi:DNA-binding IclR family transcriptional regulator
LPRAGKRSGADNGSSHNRLLSVLSLFGIERPNWTVEDAAAALDVSVTTAYRYFKSLSQVGLITPVSRAAYMLGPAIIEWDRAIQICDPMLTAARPVMLDLIQYAADGAIILLCRRFRDRVLCVHQVLGRGPQEPVSYERGRPMPLFAGATARIILANFSRRELKALFAAKASDIATAGLGRNWDTFAAGLKDLRRAGICISHGEVDRGRTGIAAPIFDAEGAILGSLSFVLPERLATDHVVARLASLTVAGAREIERAMQQAPESGRGSLRKRGTTGTAAGRARAKQRNS